MTNKVLYTNGCSFTYGCDLPEETRVEKCFASVLGRKIGFEKTINSAESGSSNERILRTTIEDILELLKKEKPENIFALINFSGFDRREFYSVLDEKFIQTFPAGFIGRLDPGDHSHINKLWEIYYTYFNHYPENLARTAIYLIGLKNFLEQKRIRYLINFTLSSFETDSLKKEIVTELTTKRILLQPAIKELLSKSIYWFDDIPGPSKHPNELGHSRWASFILSYIIDNNLLEP